MGRAADPIRYALAREIVAVAGTDVAVQRRHHPGARCDRAEGDGEAARGVRAGVLVVAAWHHGRRVARQPGRPAVGRLWSPPSPPRSGEIRIAVSARGEWHGRQVVPAGWARESTRRQMTFPGQTDRGYAYLWWHTCSRLLVGSDRNADGSRERAPADLSSPRARRRWLRFCRGDTTISARIRPTAHARVHRSRVAAGAGGAVSLRNERFKVQSAGCWVRSQFRVPDSGFGVQVFKVQGVLSDQCVLVSTSNRRLSTP